MAETVGRVTCPVCGEVLQDLRVNKNNKLYCYCDNGCKWQLNSKNSRSVLAVLRQGKSISIDKVGYIRSLQDKQTYYQEQLQAQKKELHDLAEKTEPKRKFWVCDVDDEI